jgi:O-antigen/teichoic acid export membrane protein
MESAALPMSTPADSHDATSSRLVGMRRLIARTASFAGLQGLLQLCGFVSGLLLVNLLPKSEYALVTVALSMLGAMHVLCDLGITVAVMSIGGRVCRDGRRFGSLIGTALRMRWRLALVVAPVLVVLLVVLLQRNQAGWLEIIAISGILLLCLSCELANVIYGDVVVLRALVRRFQIIDLVAALFRLAAIGLFVAGGILSALTALVAAWVGLLVRFWQLRRAAAAEVDLTAPEVPEDRREMHRIMRLQAPNALFYCIQGQIAIWILGFFAGQDQVADFGALGRFIVITAFLTAFLAAVLVPGFTWLQETSALRRRFVAIVGGMLLIALAITLVSWAMPDPLLWILGPQYNHLTAELPLMVASMMFGFLVNVVWSLNAAKAWITVSSWFNIPFTIAAQVTLACVLDLTTVQGAIWFVIGCQVPGAVLCLIDSWRGLHGAGGGRPSPPAPPGSMSAGAA